MAVRVFSWAITRQRPPRVAGPPGRSILARIRVRPCGSFEAFGHNTGSKRHLPRVEAVVEQTVLLRGVTRLQSYLRLRGQVGLDIEWYVDIRCYVNSEMVARIESRQRNVEALLAAAFDEIHDLGLAALSLRHVAQRAGASQ